MSLAERRVHKVFVTRNTEYHIRKDVCIAVRDRRSGEWLRGHLALRQRVHGGLKFTRAGGILPNLGTPGIGESIFFHADGRDLVTSPILNVDRPEKKIVLDYPLSGVPLSGAPRSR
ncbi:MAG: hypothetical protein M3Y87_32505 [Myxococcota bacterium]|nr:hypothetical protein [Myxococcota bacterium]